MNSGDIILIKWPFSDFSGIKRRPALVLHVNEFEDLLLLFITSQEPTELTDLIFLLQPTTLNRLKKVSYLRLDKIISLHSSQSTGVLGKISEQHFYDVTGALSSFIKELNYL